MDKDPVVVKAGELAGHFERTCTGCAQSAAAALLDALEIDSPEVFRAASGLADGIGLTGDGSCGALTGACMVIGLIFGRERKDHKDMMKPMQSYILCQRLYKDFINHYGSSRCYDIQKKLMGRTFNMMDPAEFKTAVEHKMMDHCSEVCAVSARKAARLILEARAKSG